MAARPQESRGDLPTNLVAGRLNDSKHPLSCGLVIDCARGAELGMTMEYPQISDPLSQAFWCSYHRTKL